MVHRPSPIDHPDQANGAGSAVAGSTVGSPSGPEGEQDQGERAQDEHVIGEVEDRAVESDGVNIEVDEVADLSQDEPVVAIPQGAGHDQGQRDREATVDRRSEGEEPVADPGGGQDRQAGEHQAAVRDIPHEAPEGPGIVAGLKFEQVGDDRERARAEGGLAELPEKIRLGRQVETRARQGDPPEKESTTGWDRPLRPWFWSGFTHPRLSIARAQVMQCFV